MSEIYTLFGASSDNGKGGDFGVDDDGKLYWNGKPIVTEKKIKLQWWVNLSAIIAAISSVVMAVTSIITLLK